MATKTYPMIALLPIRLGKSEAKGERDHRGLLMPGTPFEVFTAKKRSVLVKAGLARLDGQAEAFEQADTPGAAINKTED